jgi:hypothetical protein
MRGFAMENLDDRYDPDRWMASGKNLGDFLPKGPSADQHYAAHPELHQRVARWWILMADTVIKRYKELDEYVSEEELREMWRSTK